MFIPGGEDHAAVNLTQIGKIFAFVDFFFQLGKDDLTDDLRAYGMGSIDCSCGTMMHRYVFRATDNLLPASLSNAYAQYRRYCRFHRQRLHQG